MFVFFHEEVDESIPEIFGRQTGIHFSALITWISEFPNVNNRLTRKTSATSNKKNSLHMHEIDESMESPLTGIRKGWG